MRQQKDGRVAKRIRLPTTLIGRSSGGDSEPTAPR
jgi:hypothetical protein